MNVLSNPLYRKAVYSTLSQQTAQMGLKFAAAKKPRTNVFHALIGFGSEVGELFDGMAGYLLGVQKIDDKLRANVREELGDTGYYLSVLAKELKIKLPSSTKKVRLKGGTLGQNLFELHRLASQAIDLAKKNFYGPVLVEVDKDVKNPKTQETTTKKVKVIDPAQTLAKHEDRMAKAREIVEQALPLFWGLCYELLGEVPGQVFHVNIEKLKARYTDGRFDFLAQDGRDIPVEQQIVAGEAAQTA